MKINNILGRIGSVGLVLGLVVVPATVLPASEDDLGDRSKAVATDAKDVAVDASYAVAAEAGEVWTHIDEQGLSGRTGHEMVAWMIVGGLVGAIAGMLTSMRSTGFGRLGRLFLGLMGAFIGGLAVRLGSLDFGWTPLQIRYEEILFSFIGAVFLIVVWKLARSTTQKKQA